MAPTQPLSSTGVKSPYRLVRFTIPILNSFKRKHKQVKWFASGCPDRSSTRPESYPVGNTTSSKFLDTATYICRDGNLSVNRTFNQKFSPHCSPSPATRSTHTEPKAQEPLLWNQWDFTKGKAPPWQIKQNWDKLQIKTLLPHLSGFSLLGRGRKSPHLLPPK